MPAGRDSLRIHLPDEAATLEFGADLARAMIRLGIFPAVLLRGALGAGKTTLVRGLVAALPGGDQAEVASPSFNYMNSYPTSPETTHFDLYRLRDQGLDDDLLDALHGDRCLAVVEWAEFLPERERPHQWLWLDFHAARQGRDVTIRAQGQQAGQLLTSLQPALACFSRKS